MQKKRGIRIKLRVILTAIGLLIAIAGMLWAAVSLQHNFFKIFSAFEILGIIISLYIVNKRENPSYKIAWIVFILVLPVFGLFIYMMWGGQRTFPHLKKRFLKCEQRYMKYLEQDPAVKRLLCYEDNSQTRQASYLFRESGYPVYKDSSVTYLSPGEVFLPTLIEELKKAEKYIFIEYFIIADGKMWNAIYEVLKEKAALGIEVKVIFDDFGSIKRQYADFLVRLKKDDVMLVANLKSQGTFDIVLN